MGKLETYDADALKRLDNELDGQIPQQAAPAELVQFDPRTLPIYRHESDIQSALDTHAAVVLISPTGTGKTTQMPKIAANLGFELVQNTQPRRRPAVNAGKRILSELGVMLGEDKASEMVSWQTGQGLEGPRDARIQIMTEKILLNKNFYRPRKGDNEVWILDEIHERGHLQDELVGEAKERLANNPHFTTVFMSAHVDKYNLVNYLTDQYGQEPAVIELSAEMFPVEKREAAKSSIVKEALKAAKDIQENPNDHGGSYVIQIFQPGVNEIKDVIAELKYKLPANILAKTKLFANHAKLSPSQQAPVYEPMNGGIKIVVQTNIGKTSNTIPGTRYVITDGKERQIQVDNEGYESLIIVDISQDDIGQQFGRTGRNNSGIAILVGTDGERFKSIAERDPHAKPEIQRIKLDSIALDRAAKGDNIRTFDWQDAPLAEQIDISMSRLQALGAIGDDEQITPLGMKMVTFPATPESQRCMVESLNHAENIRIYMAAMVAATEGGGLKKTVPEGNEPGWKGLSHETGSDMLSQLDIFIAMQGKSFKEMVALDINVNNHERILENFAKLAHRAGVETIPLLIAPTEAERNLLRRCIIAGYISTIYLPKGEGLFEKYAESSATLREISNRSVVPSFTRQAVLGIARNVQMYRNGKLVLKPIIDTNIQVSLEEIAEFAPDKTGWIHEGLTMRDGKFVVVERQIFGQRSLGGRRELAPTASPAVRAACIEYVRAKPGPTLTYLYELKRDLEVLSRKSLTFTSRLTNDLIEDMIKVAAPDTILDPGLIEENLRQRVQLEQLSLDTFIGEKERARIIREAPDELKVGDRTTRILYSHGKPAIMLKATYSQNGKPTERHLADIELVKKLPYELKLRDGRPISIVYDDRRWSVDQLYRHLKSEGLL